MTAQAAFQHWLLLCGEIAVGALTLAFGVAVFVVAFSLSRKRDE